MFFLRGRRIVPRMAVVASVSGALMREMFMKTGWEDTVGGPCVSGNFCPHRALF
jgi:hypothetical protein